MSSNALKLHWDAGGAITLCSRAVTIGPDQETNISSTDNALIRRRYVGIQPGGFNGEMKMFMIVVSLHRILPSYACGVAH
jgi:hypothetical protein